MKKIQFTVIALLTAGVFAAVSPWRAVTSMSLAALHTFTTGEVPTAANLNGNFTFLNTTKVGGGVQATNSDISSSAGMSHSKMATPALLPKAWAAVLAGPCDGSSATDAVTCTVADSSQITSIKSSGTAGQYRVTLAYTPANASFGVLVTSSTAGIYCIAIPTAGTTTYATTAPQFQVACKTDAGVAGNSNFTLMVMDS